MKGRINIYDGGGTYLLSLGLEILIAKFIYSNYCMDCYSITDDRKSTRLNSSHTVISYAVFCLKKKITVRRVNTASREQYEVLVRMRLTLEMPRHRLIFVNSMERYVAGMDRVLRPPFMLKIVCE